MSNLKKELSVTRQVDQAHLLFGVCLFATGIGSIIDNLPGNIISAVALLCSAISLVCLISAKKQKGDEMSETHITKAHSMASSVTHLILAVIIAVMVALSPTGFQFHIERTSQLSAIYFIVIGLEHIAIGVLFRKYEREGC